MRFLLLPGLLAVAARSLAQSPDSTHTAAMSAQLMLSPLANLSVLPLPLSPDDSLQQQVFRRNRVKTVTLVQLRSHSPADTVDYTEVDRLGNVLRYRPAHGNAYRQRYGRGHELLARTTYPTEGFASFEQVLYNPATKTTTTSLGPSLTQLAPWQVARQARRGDTLVIESFFNPTPVMPASPIRRLVLRTFRTGADTVRSDVTVYDVAEQLLTFESYYRIGSRQRPREGGSVSFESPAAGELGQKPATARRLLVASQRQHGRYQPTTRYTYNAQGGLVRQFFIPPPHPAKPTMTLSADEQMQLTIAPINDTSSARYVRRPDGQLLREEYYIRNTPSFIGEEPLAGLSFTEYTYLPTGLRKTKAGSLAARYEYRYTYY
jgi:hypothetical protein